MAVACGPGVRPARSILLVEPDASCGQVLACLIRRGGDTVRHVRTARAALAAAGRSGHDLAVVDLLVKGGGAALARRLQARIPRVYLCVGARLLTDELVEAVVGFPVLRKGSLPGLLARRRRPPRARPSLRERVLA
jgi:CheY-like chemotaxis protein